MQIRPPIHDAARLGRAAGQELLQIPVAVDGLGRRLGE
jgi:hypothetical protein